MKKLLSIFVLFFAFTFSGLAQTEKKQAPEERAKINTFEFNKVIQVDGDTQAALYQLFVKNYTEMAKENISEAQKQEISHIIDAKLRASFSDDQIKQLETTGLYQRLIN